MPSTGIVIFWNSCETQITKFFLEDCFCFCLKLGWVKKVGQSSISWWFLSHTGQFHVLTCVNFLHPQHPLWWHIPKPSGASEIFEILGVFHHTDQQLLWRIMGHLQGSFHLQWNLLNLVDQVPLFLSAYCQCISIPPVLQMTWNLLKYHTNDIWWIQRIFRCIIETFLQNSRKFCKAIFQQFCVLNKVLNKP